MLVGVRWSCQFTFRGFSFPLHRPWGRSQADRSGEGGDRCCRPTRGACRSLGAFDLKERGRFVQTGRGTSTLNEHQKMGLVAPCGDPVERLPYLRDLCRGRSSGNRLDSGECRFPWMGLFLSESTQRSHRADRWRDLSSIRSEATEWMGASLRWAGPARVEAIGWTGSPETIGG